MSDSLNSKWSVGERKVTVTFGPDSGIYKEIIVTDERGVVVRIGPAEYEVNKALAARIVADHNEVIELRRLLAQYRETGTTDAEF